MPVRASADSSNISTVKVGFFQYDGYHDIDASGNKSGYGYDFLKLTQKYSTLNYEYVGYDKSWDEMIEMLRNGEIDMLTCASKTPEREQEFAFSMPIGTDTVNISARVSDTRLIAGDYSTYDGMRVGMLEGSHNNVVFEKFAEENGFSFYPKYYENGEQLKQALLRREIDTIVSSSLRKASNETVLSKFDEEPFYVMVRKNNAVLLNKLNYAISQMDASEGDWKNTLYYNNYLVGNKENLSLTNDEKAYIISTTVKNSVHDKSVCIAVDSDWAPYSYKVDGKYVGILPEIVDLCMNMVGMDYHFYEGADDVHDTSALQDLDVDMYVGYALSDSETERTGIITSQSILECTAAYLIRRDTTGINSIGISKVTPYLNSTLKPEDGVKLVEFENTEEAANAVMSGKVDAAYLYRYDAQYRVNNGGMGVLAYEIVPDTVIHLRAAVRASNDRTLMSIFSKCVNQVSEQQINAIISSYLSYNPGELSFKDYLYLHPSRTISLAAAVVGLLALLFVGRIHTKTRYSRKLEEKVNEISDLNRTLQENQAELERTTMAAKAANEAKTAFLFNMSHDIRTPMNAIIGYAELMERTEGDKVKFNDYLSKIQSSSSYLLSLINNVLEMARIESGKATLEETACRSLTVAEEVVAVYSELMKKKGIEFSYDYNVKTEYVYCDPIKQRQIFLNLVSNAYKYTRSGGSVKLSMAELPNDREGYTTFQTRVSDTGIGMSEEFIPLIFEQFSRESNVTDSKIEGTGLGLPIVKKLVEVMDGTIEVESELGKGSCFTVTVPHKIADKAAADAQTEYNVDFDVFSGKRILLAEDNDLNAEIAIEILSGTGVEIDRACDGAECVKMVSDAADNYYDLILMDIQMPNMNGYTATINIRQLDNKAKASIPIFAMTANAFEEDKKNAFDAGMNGHLSKPIDIDELMMTLTQVFSKQKTDV